MFNEPMFSDCLARWGFRASGVINPVKPDYSGFSTKSQLYLFDLKQWQSNSKLLRTNIFIGNAYTNWAFCGRYSMGNIAITINTEAHQLPLRADWSIGSTDWGIECTEIDYKRRHRVQSASVYKVWQQGTSYFSRHKINGIVFVTNK